VNRQTYRSHGLQDIVVIPGHGKVIIRIPFDNFGNSVNHCQIMLHGDGGKMGGVEELNCIFVYRDHRPKIL
jgi:FtsP/CotA-like multicopper oxidase with cupredoxin domain